MWESINPVYLYIIGDLSKHKVKITVFPPFIMQIAIENKKNHTHTYPTYIACFNLPLILR